MSVNLEFITGAVLSLLLVIYLFYAMLFPERF